MVAKVEEEVRSLMRNLLHLSFVAVEVVGCLLELQSREAVEREGHCCSLPEAVEGQMGIYSQRKLAELHVRLMACHLEVALWEGVEVAEVQHYLWLGSFLVVSVRLYVPACRHQQAAVGQRILVEGVKVRVEEKARDWVVVVRPVHPFEMAEVQEVDLASQSFQCCYLCSVVTARSAQVEEAAVLSASSPLQQQPWLCSARDSF